MTDNEVAGSAAFPIRVERRPCGTCPYRTDTPPGIWSAEEYVRLSLWDRPHHEQPRGVFLCHHTSDPAAGEVTLCRGWLDVRREDALGVRIAIAVGDLDPAVLDEDPAVECYPSGRAAALAGLAGVAQPDGRARAAIRHLLATNPRLIG